MNTVATKTIAAFSINFSDWYYEGQIVNIKDTSVGFLSNALIESINEDNQTFIVSSNNDRYCLSMLKLEDITAVNRRRIAV